MLNNHLYNLYSLITEESRTLWRLKNEYQKDSDHCEDCKKMCKELVENKEKEIDKLQEIIKKHM